MEILQYFPPVIYEIQDVFTETKLAYSDNYKNPFNSDIQDYSILISLREVRHELNTEKHMDNFINKLYYLNIHWGMSGLNIINLNLQNLINLQFQNIQKQKELIKFSQQIDSNLMTDEIHNLTNNLTNLQTYNTGTNTGIGEVSKLFNQLKVKNNSKSKEIYLPPSRRNQFKKKRPK